jgi:RiboL-PSP-HEPN
VEINMNDAMSIPTNEDLHQLASTATATVHPFIPRLARNIRRVHVLLRLHDEIKSDASGRFESPDDLLRAAVVFLHASLEEVLRSLAEKFLPDSSEKVLSGIPLKISGGTTGRAEKFSLGQLKQFRGKSVDDVIAASVSAHLERSNYNNTSDVCSLLDDLAIEHDGTKSFLAELSALMTRRHQIVHRADNDYGQENAVHKIERDEVQKWTNVVSEFAAYILAQAGRRHLILNGSLRAEGDDFVLTTPRGDGS